tara:strand:+ start:83 stop:367 length:285 start_codon:yes stop_codon:yes gene_type:complete
MQTQTSIKETKSSSQVQDFFISKWQNLDENNKSVLTKIWNVISYKWKWQIALNLPFLLIWVADKSIPSVHQFNLNLINSSPLPEWIVNYLEKMI